MAISISVRLGRRLKELRQKRGWNQAYLAELSGIGRAHISQLENGAIEARLGTLEALATCFEMTVADLLKGV